MEEEKVCMEEAVDGKSFVAESVNYTYEDILIIDSHEHRELFLAGSINAETMQPLAFQLLRYNRADNGIPREQRLPIVLYIDSPGGDVNAGYTLVDLIMQIDTPVYTVNIGKCDSMALYVYLAGEKRFSMPHSEFLLHEGMLGSMADSTSKMKDAIDFTMNQVEPMNKEYLLSRTNIRSDIYDRNYRVEWYFLPVEGKHLGVVHYIIGTDCTMNEVINRVNAEEHHCEEC